MALSVALCIVSLSVVAIRRVFSETRDAVEKRLIAVSGKLNHTEVLLLKGDVAKFCSPFGQGNQR